MQNISKDELKDKLKHGDRFHLVEVLSPDAYEKDHIPTAINIPLNDEFADSVQHAIPDKNGEIVVYCQNEQCDASPKAARKLEELGYTRVFDFEGGKDEWRQPSA